MKKLGIITGLAQEADCLVGGDGAEVHTGFGPQNAANTARLLIEEGCQALISFGICGGMGHSLKAGDLILPDGVIVGAGQPIQVDGPWRERLLAKLEGITVTGGILVGTDQVVSTQKAKHCLHDSTNAIAVDMESHSIAKECDKAGVPFLVIRTVSDPADGYIPKSAVGCVDDQGRAQVMVVVLGLLKRPWELAGLLRLKRDSDAAFEALRRVAALAGPGFGLGD